MCALLVKKCENDIKTDEKVIHFETLRDITPKNNRSMIGTNDKDNLRVTKMRSFPPRLSVHECVEPADPGMDFDQIKMTTDHQTETGIEKKETMIPKRDDKKSLTRAIENLAKRQSEHTRNETMVPSVDRNEPTFLDPYLKAIETNNRRILRGSRVLRLMLSKHECVAHEKLLGESNSLASVKARVVFKYPCDFCDVKCTKINELVQHQRKHKRDKRYRCVYCDKSFRSWLFASHHWKKECRWVKILKGFTDDYIRISGSARLERELGEVHILRSKYWNITEMTPTDIFQLVRPEEKK